MKLSLSLTNINNDQLFKKKNLEQICRSINENTNSIDFYIHKISKTKFGLRNALIRSKHKHNSKNTKCKILIYENSKGRIKTSLYKGLMLSFTNDVNKFINSLKK